MTTVASAIHSRLRRSMFLKSGARGSADAPVNATASADPPKTLKDPLLGLLEAPPAARPSRLARPARSWAPICFFLKS